MSATIMQAKEKYDGQALLDPEDRRSPSSPIARARNSASETTTTSR